ncbi:MAG TPA: sigma-70 family RNA polymerase sigma factor [Longimicrobiales bacterium]|nr:sigma-70 family RNA polymerase sigma factor [Longimicrobiales bacterium]
MNDRELLHQLRTGDTAAVEALYRAHFQGLCAFAARITGSASAGEEIAEEVIVRVWERRETLAVRTSLRAYLFGAVRRQALLRLRDSKNRARLLETAAADGMSPATAGAPLPPDEALDAARLAGALRTAIAALPDRAREAFTLKRAHGLSQAEIADAMEISESTVEKHLARAMDGLRTALADWRR